MKEKVGKAFKGKEEENILGELEEEASPPPSPPPAALSATNHPSLPYRLEKEALWSSSCNYDTGALQYPSIASKMCVGDMVEYVELKHKVDEGWKEVEGKEEGKEEKIKNKDALWSSFRNYDAEALQYPTTASKMFFGDMVEYVELNHKVDEGWKEVEAKEDKVKNKVEKMKEKVGKAFKGKEEENILGESKEEASPPPSPPPAALSATKHPSLPHRLEKEAIWSSSCNYNTGGLQYPTTGSKMCVRDMVAANL
ncbi:hypothetical protein H6P81_010150 [Aristolochia fimbriata]|uniref:Uncharacterized protein n=1 Tax=Aristolochia fimbriata TaxID=158543 RepID=A0AAV7EN11_ARIFI|nr:hypothetical protein H6P81_010150 [Aristolochia fimbriata]